MDLSKLDDVDAQIASVSEVIAQLIDGAYPDVTRIIPQSHTSRAVVNAGELLTATKMVSAFVDKNGKATRVGFRMEGDKKVRFAKRSGELIDR